MVCVLMLHSHVKGAGLGLRKLCPKWCDDPTRHPEHEHDEMDKRGGTATTAARTATAATGVCGSGEVLDSRVRSHESWCGGLRGSAFRSQVFVHQKDLGPASPELPAHVDRHRLLKLEMLGPPDVDFRPRLRRSRYPRLPGYCWI